MDGEILSDRLAAAEDAVIKLDERLDEVEDEAEEREEEVTEEPASNDVAILITNERITSLEESIAECRNELAALRERQSATETVAIAALTSEQENLEPEEMLEPEVQEIAPEPESEAEEGREKSGNWLERFLTLR
jgi:uncharacterized coiled-coil DUF342 family protein